MDVNSPDPSQILLLLDLSLDNPIPEDEVLALLPRSTQHQVLRVSEFGAKATTRGQRWSGWRGWTLAVDAMLAAAQARVPQGVTPRYYVAGRASLPLFAYLGMRRGRQGELTVLNQRGSDWDIIPTTPDPRPYGRPMFADPRVLPGDAPEGLVGVFISTGYPAPEAAIAAYFDRHGEKLAATVVLEAPQDERWLTAETASAAAYQIQALMFDLRRQAPHARGAALFLAGPAPLAVMAGRYLNPHMYRPIWIPTFDANDYREAVRWPHGAAHGDVVRVLLLTASPADLTAIRVAQEEKEVKRHIEAGKARGARVELHVVRGAMLDDILSAMNEFRPHILHIAAHGSQNGDLWLLNDLGDRVVMPLAGFLAAIESAAKDLTLLLLNACYSRAAAEVLRQHVDCAIGVRTKVADASALAYIEAFYAALGHGLAVSEAHEQGLAQLKLKCLPNSGDIELLVRAGCDAGDWIPLPGAAKSTR